MDNTNAKYNNKEFTYRKPDYSLFRPKPYYSAQEDPADEVKKKLEAHEARLKQFKHHRDLLK